VLLSLQYVEHNLQASEDTSWLQNYMKEFPRANKSEATVGSFWLDEYAYLSTQMEGPEETQDIENRHHRSEASRAEPQKKH
jgi:hypothetical protein